MKSRRSITLVLVAMVAVLALVLPAGGVTENLPTEFTSGGVRWGDLTGDDSGFYNEGNACGINGADLGFAMGDAFLLATSQTDPFDDVGAIRLPTTDTYWPVPGGLNAPVDLTGSTLTTPSGPLGGFNVWIQWAGMPGSPTIRELVAVTNPGATDVTQRVQMDLNYGSDNTTFVYQSSNGDESWTTADRWIATADGPDPTEFPTGEDPPITSVFYGPGAPESPVVSLDGCDGVVAPNDLHKGAADTNDDADAAATTSADDAVPTADVAPDGDVSGQQTLLPPVCDSSQCEAWSLGFDMNIPAGQTRYLMFFWQLYSTPGAAAAAGPTFDTVPASDSEFLAGIDPAIIPLIVNWDFRVTVLFTG